MNDRRTLLLTSHPPGGHGVGQIYTRSLCRLLPDQSVAVVALQSPDDHWSPDDDAGLIDWQRLSRRYESAYRPCGGVFGEAAAAAGVRGLLQPHAGKLVAQAAGWGRTVEIERLIAILDGPSVMLMAAPLADRLGVPLHTLVWDVPDHVLPSFGHTRWSARPLQAGFNAALRRSRSVAVMSRSMQRRFEADYGVRTAILRQPIESAWSSSAASMTPHAADDFVIGFAGSATARDEMELLCRTLDAMNWSIGGRRVRLRVYGLRFVCQAQTPRWIEYRGYVPETADVVAGLSECDVLFLPQPFQDRGRAFAEYSFPTKFTTYLAAGRPTLILSPPYSALSEFCREQDLPIVCGRLQEDSVRDHLQRLVGDSEWRDDVARRLRAVAAEEFAPELALSRLREWLADPEAQAPSSLSPKLETSEVHAVAGHH